MFPGTGFVVEGQTAIHKEHTTLLISPPPSDGNAMEQSLVLPQTKQR